MQRRFPKRKEHRTFQDELFPMAGTGQAVKQTLQRATRCNLCQFLFGVGPGGRGPNRRDFSCEAVEVWAHDIERPANFGMMPKLLGRGFLVPPRIAERLDRDVDADAIAKAKTTGNRLCDAIDRHRHALDDMPADSFRHHFPGEPRQAERRTSVPAHRAE
jgi:hypothetical protein